jgi:hypothetical protein
LTHLLRRELRVDLGPHPSSAAHGAAPHAPPPTAYARGGLFKFQNHTPKNYKIWVLARASRARLSPLTALATRTLGLGLASYARPTGLLQYTFRAKGRCHHSQPIAAFAQKISSKAILAPVVHPLERVPRLNAITSYLQLAAGRDPDRLGRRTSSAAD